MRTVRPPKLEIAPAPGALDSNIWIYMIAAGALILVVCVLFIVLPRILRAKDIQFADLSLFRFFAIRGFRISSGGNDPVEGRVADSPNPDSTAATTDSSPGSHTDTPEELTLESLGPDKTRVVLRCFQEMDDVALAILGAGSTTEAATMESGDPAAAMGLALTIARQILERAHRIFDEVLWPGTEVVTSLKTIHPENHLLLTCEYPGAREIAIRRYRDSQMQPIEIRRDGTLAGRVFEEGVPRFLDDCKGAARFLPSYQSRLYDELKIESLVAWPIRLSVNDVDHTVAVLKVDCNRAFAIHECELAKLMLKSVATKFAVVFQVACRDCPELLAQLNSDASEHQ